MALAVPAPIFVFNAMQYINIGVLVALLAIETVAIVSCVRQRADAFPVVGPVSKVGWMGILAASLGFTFLCWRINALTLMIWSAAAAATLIYLLDVRPALRDAVDGSGPW
jgi:hypothetical protein